jgi:uncharacterized delta-60 repeat protein
MKNRFRLMVFLSSLTLLTFTFSQSVTADAGERDTTFGTDGYVITDIASATDKSFDLTTDSKGRIILVGFTGGDFAIIRYQVNGTLDTSFGNNGVVITDFGDQVAFASGVAVDALDRVVVVGDVDKNLTVARYNNDGTLDTTFNGVGYVQYDDGIDLDISTFSNDIVIDNAGNIVVTGDNNGTFSLLRYTSAGALDVTFDGDGIVTTDFPTPAEQISSVTIDGQNRILVAGALFNAPSCQIGIARYLPSGALDTTFNGSGTLASIEGCGAKVLVDSAGRVLLSANVGNFDENSLDFLAMRFTDVGTLDTTFGTNGSVITDFGAPFNNITVDAVLTADDKLIQVGYRGDTNNERFILSRLNEDGSLDTTFGTAGKVIDDLTFAGDFAQSGVLDANGNILVGGSTFVTGQSDNFIVARYKGDDLARNGTFEVDNNSDNFPDEWVGTNIQNNDKRVCNKSGKPNVAFEGQCAFQFKGVAGIKSRIEQDIDLVSYNIQEEDRLIFSYYLAASLPNGAVGEIKSGGQIAATTPNARIIIRAYPKIFNDNYALQKVTVTGYQISAVNITLTAQEDGKFRFDAISLLLQKATDPQTLIPIPLAQ